jgi:hypothetical protein
MRRLAIAIAAVLAGGSAVAADALESAQACARVQDSLQRLVCYDRLFPPGQPAVGVASAPAPASTGIDEFGADGIKRSDSERKADSAPRSMTAAVTEARESRPNVFRVTLDNGQVWQQMDMDSLFTVRAGDTVQIERGRLGGYRMARTGRGGSNWVRVNRVK